MSYFLLRENGDRLLRENGDRLLREFTFEESPILQKRINKYIITNIKRRSFGNMFKSKRIIQ